MDAYEATRTVFSKIQKLDPENASKIMGLLLIQDHGDKEMIRLAFGPESLVQSAIIRVRKELGMSSNSPSNSPSALSSPSPFHGHNSSRFGAGIRVPSSLSIPNSNSNFPMSEDIYSRHNNGINNFAAGNSLSPAMNATLPFYGGEIMDEFQLQDQLSFLDDGPDFGSSTNLNYDGDFGSHRRSCSLSNIGVGSDDSVSGFGWKPCLYYARGYCKNGANCRFLHSGGGPNDSAAMVGSPVEQQCEELLRSKSANQQQRSSAASQLLSSASFPYSVSQSMDLFMKNHQNDSQRTAAALLMNDEMNKLGRSRLDRNMFPMNGMVDMNPGSRQIYLTFPADSTFREEDVSNYFSIYGLVQDVRIPYQQKRMFGFVTLVYAETVKIILAKGNPHFVCDARVLVKPYKEKGKFPDKKNHVERGDFSACNSPTGLDPRDPFDLPIGPRMFYNNQDMLWRRKLEEQADMQQAIELQSRRLMSLQLLDLKKHHHHRALSAGGAPIGSPIQSPSFFNQSPFFHSDHSSSSESPPDNCSSPATAFSDPQLHHSVYVGAEKEPNGNNGNGKESDSNEENDFLESCLEHNLPDSPFASPTKAAGEYYSAFSTSYGDVFEKNSANTSVNNNKIATSLNSFYYQMPRLSGQGTIGM